jgi:phosphoribosylformylglycinamidine synthase
VTTGVGARIDGPNGHAALFGEAPSRVLACIAPDRVARITEQASALGVPVRTLGEAGGDRVVVEGLLDVAVATMTAAWRSRLPDAFGVAVTH